MYKYFIKPKIIFCFFTVALASSGGLLKALSSESILIESIESKNRELQPVYNEIKWTSTPKNDIWMMNQSHYGIKAHKNQWERLAIVIDKTKKPMIARFYQLKAGPLEWSEILSKKRTPYRASCFTCHSNGPRAIRPENNSQNAPLGFSDRIKILEWNLRIKTYGRIHYDPAHDQEDVSLVPPFHYVDSREQNTLKIPTCLKCHNENSFFGRGMLQRQQSGTIKHLVETNQMPPLGFTLTNKEKNDLRDFLRGF